MDDTALPKGLERVVPGSKPGRAQVLFPVEKYTDDTHAMAGAEAMVEAQKMISTAIGVYMTEKSAKGEFVDAFALGSGMYAAMRGLAAGFANPNDERIELLFSGFFETYTKNDERFAQLLENFVTLGQPKGSA